MRLGIVRGSDMAWRLPVLQEAAHFNILRRPFVVYDENEISMRPISYLFIVYSSLVRPLKGEG